MMPSASQKDRPSAGQEVAILQCLKNYVVVIFNKLLVCHNFMEYCQYFKLENCKM